MRYALPLMLLFQATSAVAQNETLLGSDFRREGEDFQKNCTSFQSIPSCLQTLFTEAPMHVTAGSIAPENGVAFGGAFVEDLDLQSWRLNFNADAVASTNQSWRAGFYFKAARTPTVPPITIITKRPTHPLKPSPPPPSPEFNFYAQAISLNKLDYYGLGNSTSRDSLALYGMREMITGGNAVIPVLGNSGLALYGELNGRFVSLRGLHGDTAPSIEQLYTLATAPGLASQPGFLQMGEGLRYSRSFSDRFVMDYSVMFQEFVAPSNSTFSFNRLVLDATHVIPLYSKTVTGSAAQNGPDGSKEALGQHKYVANREGSVSLGATLLESYTSASHVVPFYFQPTIGGSDINGDQGLPSYPDYRFRGPNLLLFHGTIDHSIWGPFGLALLADYGKVATTHGDIDFEHFRHSWAAGLTIRAGGLPQVWILFAWAGHEGTHTIASISPSLLGATSRPSLY